MLLSLPLGARSMMQTKGQRLYQWMPVLEKNGIVLEYDVESVGNMIIRVAEGLVDVPGLAHYLRSL